MYDERVNKNEQKILGSLFPVYLILLATCLVIKLVVDMYQVMVYIDLGIIALSIAYYLVANLINKTLFVKSTDEYITSTKMRIKSNSAAICFFFIIIAMGITLFLPEEVNDTWGFIYFMYLMLFMIPGIYFLIMSYKTVGLSVDTAKRQEAALKHLKLRSAVSGFTYAVSYYTLNIFTVFIEDNVIFIVIFQGILFGLLMYLVQKFLIKKSQKS